MNGDELFELLAGLEGSRDSGADGSGIVGGRLVNGIEYGLTAETEERKLRASWKRRQGGGATPLMLIADDPDTDAGLRVLGPAGEGPLRRVRAESLGELVSRTVGMGELEAVRFVSAEIDRLDTERIAGVVIRGLGTEHLFGTRLPRSPRWHQLSELAPAENATEWRDLLDAFGYQLERLPDRGWLARSGAKPVAVIHPKRSAREFARLDDGGHLPEGALLSDCDAHGTPFGLLVAGSRIRLLRASGTEGGVATRYLELDGALIEPDRRPLLALLTPAYLSDGGFEDLLAEARDYGAELRLRLDRSLRQRVLPTLGRELGRWAENEGIELDDDGERHQLEAAALTFVFRVLFLLYAESAGHLPMANHTYAQRSMTRIAERASEELGSADSQSTSLWRDYTGLVEAMRVGQAAWGVPAYNGGLFARDDFAGADLLERAAIPDEPLGRALVALARATEDEADVGVDFSGLEVGHLGHIYEGLLSLRLSVADRDFSYDERRDRYVDADPDDPDAISAGELLWLTNEGGRKGGGVYYTRAELVRHLVVRSVRPALAEHLAGVREVATKDPARAARLLFEFFVLDPACGSAHFLVEVVDEIADQIAELLGEVALPALREELDALRAAAGTAVSVEVEDAALLKRLVLKRCVYGVDLSPMGAEIAKVSLWLATFVPGLSLAYLDHNIQVGNSLIGVARPEAMAPPEAGHGTLAMFDEPIVAAIADAALEAAKLREISDRTPEEVEASREAAIELEHRVAGAKRVLDLWTAEPLGLDGARQEASERAAGIVAGDDSLLADRASELADANDALHWPLRFAEVFAREQPGFDVIVGNPPWDEVKVEELGFFLPYAPGVKALSPAARRRAIAGLREQRPELAEAFTKAREAADLLRVYLGPHTGYAGSVGDPDLYRYFCQRYQELLRPAGRLGVVLPRTAFINLGSAEFRRWLFSETALERIDFLLNHRNWAFDIHPQYAVALIAATRREPRENEHFEVAGVASSAGEFATQSAGEGLQVAQAALGPNLEVPLLPTQAHADLLAKLRTGGAFALGGGRWRCFPVAEFHETNDKRLWEDAQDGWPLWKGASFDIFDPNGAEARVCPPSDAALAKARKPRPGAGSIAAVDSTADERREAVSRKVGRARVAFRGVTNRENSRTVIACLTPPEHFLVNSAPYLAFLAEDPLAEMGCLAIMSSLIFDWQARRFVQFNLNFFILEGLRLPALDDEAFDALASAAARLSCEESQFAEFAAEVGVDCGELAVEERSKLRAEIDAWVAWAWQLTEAELELVFSDFTPDAVPEAYREAVRARFGELA